MLFDIILNFFFKLIRREDILCKNNRCLNHLSSDRVGCGSDSTFKNIRQFHNDALNFKRSDSVAAGFYQIIGTADIPEKAVCVAISSISGMIVVVVPCFVGQRLITVVAGKHPDLHFVSGVQYDFYIGDITSATEETDQSFQLISTYPNPVMDELKIDLLGFEGKELSFRLVDVNGKTLLTKKYRSESGNETTDLDLSKLAPGMYFLHGTDGNRNWVREVVKTN